MSLKFRQSARSTKLQSGPRHGSAAKAVFSLERSCPETSMAPVLAIVWMAARPLGWDFGLLRSCNLKQRCFREEMRKGIRSPRIVLGLSSPAAACEGLGKAGRKERGAR